MQKNSSDSPPKGQVTQHQGEQLRLYLSQLQEIADEGDLFFNTADHTLNEYFAASITYQRHIKNADTTVLSQGLKDLAGDTISSLMPSTEGAASLMTESSTSTLFGLRPSRSSLDLSRLNGREGDHSQHTPLEQEESSDFYVESILGEGGMGRVYSGHQTCLKREVALKVSKITPNEPQLIAQVFHEAQIMANLDHPNILPIYLLALDKERQPVQVMKQINGVTWSELLNNGEHEFWSKLDYPDGKTHFHLQVLAQVCQAMSYAHDHQVIHRDLKPENVMIGRFGETFVLDWGVALFLPAIDCREEDTDYVAQVRSGLAKALVGTPVYMPPEMARCDVESLGPWSDVYLLGAILYEVLCKRRMRKSQNIKDLFTEILHGSVPEFPAFVSEEFRSLLTSSLANSIEERIPNAHSFRKLLLHAIRTQKAAKVHRRAHDLHLELRQTIANETCSRSEASAMYDQALLIYHTSLEMWSECERAQAGLDALHTLWAKFLIDHEDLEGAKHALSRLTLPHPELSQRLEVALDEKSRRDQESVALQEWRDGEKISHSRPLRIIFSTIGLLIFGFGSLFLNYLERQGTIEIDSKGGFVAAVCFSVVVFLAFAISAIRRRKSSNEANAIFQRLFSYLVVICIAVSLQRFISWQIGLTYQVLLHIEMSLIALGCFGLSFISGKRDFMWGGLAYGAVSLISISFPEYAPTLFSLAMVALWSGVLISWWRDTEE